MCNCTDPQTTLPNLDQWELEWSPGDLIVDANNDAEGMHEEMDKVEYPADDNDDDKDHDAGGVFFARGPTIITNDEDVEDIDEDRSNDNKEYKGDWTNKLSQEDEPEESEEEHDSKERVAKQQYSRSSRARRIQTASWHRSTQ